jgi:hypothetical protein
VNSLVVVSLGGQSFVSESPAKDFEVALLTPALAMVFPLSELLK